MTRLRIFCADETCRDSLAQAKERARPMLCVGETPSAWQFKCQTCGSRRAWTKNLVGGTMGAGERRDDGTVALKYAPGWRP